MFPGRRVSDGGRNLRRSRMSASLGVAWGADSASTPPHFGRQDQIPTLPGASTGIVMGSARESNPSLQFVEQCLCLLQVGGVEPLGEPAVDWCEEVVGLVPLALLGPESGEGGGGAEFQRAGLLLPSEM
jgi:hypothetical protein